jgi:uncharacterized protein involved in exopolysaccharide biosynthesis
MNNSLAVPNDGSWPLAPYAPPGASPAGQRTYSATSILDFPTLIRILHHWRWLVLGAVAAGLLGGILITLVTTPIYRAWVTLEANPPTFSVSDEQSREREASNSNTYDFVATQVGLVSSKSVAQRPATARDILATLRQTIDSLPAVRRGRWQQAIQALENAVTVPAAARR